MPAEAPRTTSDDTRFKLAVPLSTLELLKEITTGVTKVGQSRESRKLMFIKTNNARRSKHVEQWILADYHIRAIFCAQFYDANSILPDELLFKIRPSESKTRLIFRNSSGFRSCTSQRSFLVSWLPRNVYYFILQMFVFKVIRSFKKY